MIPREPGSLLSGARIQGVSFPGCEGSSRAELSGFPGSLRPAKGRWVRPCGGGGCSAPGGATSCGRRVAAAAAAAFSGGGDNTEDRQGKAAGIQLHPLGRRRVLPGGLLLDGDAACPRAFALLAVRPGLGLAAVAAVGVRVVLGGELGAGLSPLDDRHAVGEGLQLLPGALQAGGGPGPGGGGGRGHAGAFAQRNLLSQQLGGGQELGGHGVQVVDQLDTPRLPGRPALKPGEVLQDFFGACLKSRMERIQVGLNGRFQRSLPIL